MEVFHPFLERELEFDIPLFHVNNSTNGAKKRTSQNNWTRGLTLDVHNSEINGNIIVIDNDKNIVDFPQRILYGRINKTNTKRTRIKRFQFKISYILLGITKVLAPHHKEHNKRSYSI